MPQQQLPTGSCFWVGTVHLKVVEMIDNRKTAKGMTTTNSRNINGLTAYIKPVYKPYGNWLGVDSLLLSC